MNIRRKTAKEMFEDYEKALTAYMKANGAYKVRFDLSHGEFMLVQDLRNQVQDYRRALLEKLSETVEA